MTAPKERGILMSGPMVRAILAGKKTQTRRAVKPIDGIDVHDSEVFYQGHGFGGPGSRDRFVPCPYGQTGDRLWVRETTLDDGTGEPGNIHYRANATAADIADLDARGLRWTPSMLMPRSRCRITLAVESIRVERAQAISDADVEAEGVDAEAVRELLLAATRKRRGEAWPPEDAARWGERGIERMEDLPRRELWRLAWTLINGRDRWDANPWVWVVSFRRTP